MLCRSDFEKIYLYSLMYIPYISTLNKLFKEIKQRSLGKFHFFFPTSYVYSRGNMVESIHVAQDRDKWWALSKVVMKLVGSAEWGKVLD